jgi:hypothetical protein
MGPWACGVACRIKIGRYHTGSRRFKYGRKVEAWNIGEG